MSDVLELFKKLAEHDTPRAMPIPEMDGVPNVPGMYLVYVEISPSPYDERGKVWYPVEVRQSPAQARAGNHRLVAWFDPHGEGRQILDHNFDAFRWSVRMMTPAELEEDDESDEDQEALEDGNVITIDDYETEEDA